MASQASGPVKRRGVASPGCAFYSDFLRKLARGWLRAMASAEEKLQSGGTLQAEAGTALPVLSA